MPSFDSIIQLRFSSGEYICGLEDIRALMISPIDLSFRALQPPQWRKSWHVGVRVAANKKLVAFISGVPADIRTYDV